MERGSYNLDQAGESKVKDAQKHKSDSELYSQEDNISYQSDSTDSGISHLRRDNDLSGTSSSSALLHEYARNVKRDQEPPIVEDHKDLCRDAREVIKKLQSGKPHKRLNILFLGKTGAGKSTLINSLVMCLNKRGYEYIVENGAYGYEACSVTTHLERFSIHKILKECKFQTKIKFWDCPGLPDMPSDNTTFMVLKLLMQGRMPPSVRLDDLTKKSAEELEKEFKSPNLARQIDIVFFVQAMTDEVPAGLCKTLTRLRREIKVFPILAIITKTDSEKPGIPTVEELKIEMAERLGMPSRNERIFPTKVYCGDITPKMTRCGDIDEAMSKIWLEVFKVVPQHLRAHEKVLQRD